MIKKGSLFLILFLSLIGCSLNKPPSEPQTLFSSSSDEKINTPEVIANHLAVPWSIQKSGPVFYISEREGTIAQIDNGKLERQKVELEKSVATDSEAGLLGFFLAPDFKETAVAYGYYSYEEEGQLFNRVVTLYLKKNLWTEKEVLLDRIPGGSNHDGGRIKIGPDQKLYVTTGDTAERSLSQDVDSLAGKILRMNLDGSIPDDNPYPNSYVYSHGHRNPQGITWIDRDTMYASEHGDTSHDEINKIEAGHNYGWPFIQGKETRTGMEAPVFTSGPNKTWAPSGMDNDKNNLYVAGLRGATIYKFDLETMDVQELIAGMGRIRDVFIEGENLYFITNNTDGRGSPGEKDDILYRISLPE